MHERRQTYIHEDMQTLTDVAMSYAGTCTEALENVPEEREAEACQSQLSLLYLQKLSADALSRAIPLCPDLCCSVTAFLHYVCPVFKNYGLMSFWTGDAALDPGLAHLFPDLAKE